MRPQLGKQKIIDAALTLFTEHGFHKTSISKIAKEAGVSKGLTYNYFDTKEELLFAIIDHASESMIEIAERLVSDAGYQTTLLNFLDDYFHFLRSNKEFLALQLGLLFQPDLKNLTRPLLEKRSNRLYKITRTMFKRSRVFNPDQSAKRFMSELDGIALHYLFVFDKYPLEEMVKQLFNNYKNLGK